MAEEKYLTVYENTKDLNIIRNMKGHCLIVSEDWLMRGIDYRINVPEGATLDKTDGIDLLIAKPF